MFGWGVGGEEGDIAGLVLTVQYAAKTLLSNPVPQNSNGPPIK